MSRDVWCAHGKSSDQRDEQEITGITDDGDAVADDVGTRSLCRERPRTSAPMT